MELERAGTVEGRLRSQEERKSASDKHLLFNNISHIKGKQYIFQRGEEYRILHFHFENFNLDISKLATYNLCSK